ncbi:hypothetical protein SISNIDRAFT_493291 [Sistotremastrum niveocremeum HHB9708]|uniref:F-box domain-containing protein n=1 Tax=Sistotremastrum niveocremeum HHB9708 TaxID=1314777 RepID=A0A164YLQ6_9AGAM|nr:hypothetical protein SISNIDRAFT_493291 [Sistotremastrum niveocremeum HHB9708]
MDMPGYPTAEEIVPLSPLHVPAAVDPLNEVQGTDAYSDEEALITETNETVAGHSPRISHLDAVLSLAPDQSEKDEEIIETPDTRFFPALQLREVLAEIMSHMDIATNAAAARVSTLWSSVALDALYRTSPELLNLLSILAPIAESSFARELVPSDWVRFSRYATRVRSLSHETNGSLSSRHLSESVFQELALSRPSMELLPNLQTLRWTASRPRFLRSALVFIHKGLTSLTLSITRPDGAKFLESIFYMLSERTPNLTHFELDCPRPVSEYEDSFVTFLSSLQRLRRLVLPHFFLTTAVMHALGPLPDLLDIVLQKGDHVGASKDLASLSFPTNRDFFPCIRTLSLDSSLFEAQRLLGSKGSRGFSTLTELHISSLALESPHDIQSFIACIPEFCPNLTSLMLALLALSVVSPSHPTEITLPILKPVLNIPHLIDFGITYNYPLKLTNADVAVLAENWPNLRSLYLCESSYDTHERSATSLTLHSLLPFAKHCSKLEQLGIFIDACPPESSDDDCLDLTSTRKTFESLKLLLVGQSFLPPASVVPTALFLAEILPPNCEFSTGCTDRPHCFSPVYHEASPNPESDDAFQSRLNQWAEVKKLVPAFHSVKMGERERAQQAEQQRRELADEVESLKKQLAALQGTSTQR